MRMAQEWKWVSAHESTEIVRKNAVHNKLSPLSSFSFFRESIKKRNVHGIFCTKYATRYALMSAYCTLNEVRVQKLIDTFSLFIHAMMGASQKFRTELKTFVDDRMGKAASIWIFKKQGQRDRS